MSKLTALKVKNAKPGRHLDGRGLYLLVKPSGSKSWVLRVQVDGVRRDYGLGSADLLSLNEAREKAREGRKLAKAGRNPALEWRRARESVPTFELAARRYHESIKAGWRNGKHKDQWLSTMEKYAFPLIGRRQVDQVDAPAMHSVLAPIWLEIPETARRVRQRIGATLDFAHAMQWRPVEAPMRAVNRGLPRQPKKTGHFAAMPFKQLPLLMKSLAEGEATVGRLALRFTILTAARSSETRKATWEQIDWEAKVWVVPPENTKVDDWHRVPLSPAALEILEQIKALFGERHDALIFPGSQRKKPISENTMAKALSVAGGDTFTVHGMRSSFRDWAAEETNFPPAWAEAALSHKLKDRVEAAYLRTRYLDQRRVLMDAWADFLIRGSNVVKLSTVGVAPQQ